MSKYSEHLNQDAGGLKTTAIVEDGKWVTPTKILNFPDTQDVRITKSNAQEPFNGIAGTLKLVFTKPMNGLLLSNDGSSSLQLKVNGYYFEVKAGEIFHEVFHPFTEIIIIGTDDVPFRGYARGENGISTTVSEDYLVVHGAKYGISSAVNTYKGSEFEMKTAKTLKRISFYGGTATAWQIWKTKGSRQLDTIVASGTITDVTVDIEGYHTFNLATSVNLEANTFYCMMLTYSAAGQRLTYLDQDGEVTNGDVLKTTGVSWNTNTVPATNQFDSAKTYSYDFKLGW